MFQRILVAIDGSEHAARALREAIDLAVAANAKLTVLSVSQRPSVLFVAGPIVPPLDLGELDEAIESEHERLLDEAISEVPEGVSVERVLAHGSPARAILDQARTGAHDLIVLGSRGRGDVVAMLLGSVSHQVLHSSRIPVLVVDGSDDRATRQT